MGICLGLEQSLIYVRAGFPSGRREFKSPIDGVLVAVGTNCCYPLFVLIGRIQPITAGLKVYVEIDTSEAVVNYVETRSFLAQIFY